MGMVFDFCIIFKVLVFFLLDDKMEKRFFEERLREKKIYFFFFLVYIGDLSSVMVLWKVYF